MKWSDVKQTLIHWLLRLYRRGTEYINLKLGARLMARKKEIEDSSAENTEAVTVSAEEAAEKVVSKKPAAKAAAPAAEQAAVKAAAPSAEQAEQAAATADENCVPQEGDAESTESADTMAMVIDEAQEVAANGIVKNHIIASIALGLVPVPLFDLAALTAAQMSMLRNLSEHYGVPFEESGSKALLASLVGGSLPVLGAVGFSSFIKLIPGIGTLGGSASLSIVAGAVTYAIGQTFIMHFEKGGTFEDFDPKLAREFFQREVDNGKEFVQTMRDELGELKDKGSQMVDQVQEKGSQMVDQVQETGSQIVGKGQSADAEKPETAKA